MKLKSVKTDYKKDQIEQYTKVGSPDQIRADSESTNPDPMQDNHIIYHKIKQIWEVIRKIQLKNLNTYLSMYFENGVLQVRRSYCDVYTQSENTLIYIR